MWLQIVRRQAICLRVANQMSTRIRFFPTRVSSKSICLNDFVRVPRGPLTVTVRHLHDTVTVGDFITQTHYQYTRLSINSTSQPPPTYYQGHTCTLHMLARSLPLVYTQAAEVLADCLPR